MPQRHEEHEAISAETEATAQKVIGACIAVHRASGPAYLEGVYEEALAVETQCEATHFARQAPVGVVYRGRQVGQGDPDFLVERSVVLDIKAVDELHPKHTAQVLSCLKATNLRLGLLVNFQSRILKDSLRRVIL